MHVYLLDSDVCLKLEIICLTVIFGIFTGLLQSSLFNCIFLLLDYIKFFKIILRPNYAKKIRFRPDRAVRYR